MSEGLPIVGGDKGAWGGKLNSWLGQSHNQDGTLKQSAVDAANKHLRRMLGVAPSGAPVLADFQAFNALITPRSIDLSAFPQAFPSSEPIAYQSQLDLCDSLGTAPLIYAEPAGTLNTATGGTYNANIDSSASLLADWGKTLYISLADEFNGTWTQYGYNTETAAQFIAGFQYIIDRLRLGGADIRVIWAPNVWHASNTVDPSPYYPGDDYVDYLGLDAFVASTAAPRVNPSTLILQYYQTLAALAAKPFMMAAMGCSAFPGEWAQDDVVVNGSFETFDSTNQPHGWTVGGTATAVTKGTSMGSASTQEGYACCVLNHSTGTCTIAQTVNIVGGKTYKAAWWTHVAATGYQEPYSIKVVGGASSGQFLQASGGAWGATDPGLTFTGPTSGVTQTIVTFTPPSDATGITLTLGNTAGTCWVDNVQVYTTAAASYKTWWYQQFFALVESSMPSLVGVSIWNQNGSDGDYRIDSGGADLAAAKAFQLGVQSYPSFW